VRSSLLIPWSCRVSFTEDICGLPGVKEGCWRHREADKPEFGPHAEKLRKTAVGPSLPPPGGLAWLVFTQKAGDDALSGRVEFLNAGEFAAQYLPGDSAGGAIVPAPGAHQVFFGFTAEGLTNPVPTPCFAAFYGVHPEHPNTRPVPIRNWRQEKPNLYACFGNLTFLPQKYPGLKGEFSLADLITAYLDGACKHYRLSDLNLGVTRCKLECHLGPKVLCNAWAVFSYLDPSTLQLKKLPGQSLGWFSPRPDGNPIDTPGSFRLLQSSEQASDASGAITYADTYIGAGRRHILSSEVGRSFLCFSKSEVAAYLLFWYLVRALASTCPAGQKFVEAFSAWRDAYDGSGDHAARFADLLATPADLARDEFIQTQLWRGLAAATPRPFAAMLEALDLGVAPSPDAVYRTGGTLSSVVEFLGSDLRNKGFSSLPMYEGLDWEPGPELQAMAVEFEHVATCEQEALECVLASPSSSGARSGPVATCEQALECVLAALSHGFRNQPPAEVARLARERLARLSRRCVFPIPHVLEESGRGFDLRLMSALNDVSGILTEGEDLIIVAAVNHVLHFRIFDRDGKVVVDTDERRLTEQARQIEDLRRQLEGLWPLHKLTESEKVRVIAAVTSIVGHTRSRLDFNHYYVIPIWEDSLRGRRRPLIFAHVFSRASHLDAEDELIQAEGLQWQDAMIPFGVAIARSYYEQLSQSVSEYQTRLALLGLISHCAGNAVSAKDWVSARVFLGLVGLTATPGPLREKYQSEHSYTAEECLNEAIGRIEDRRAIEKEIGQEERVTHLSIDRARWDRVQFPDGYLLKDYVITFLYEILLNSATHGAALKTPEGRIVRVGVSIGFDSGAEEARFMIWNVPSKVELAKKLTPRDGLLLPREAGEYSQQKFLSLLNRMRLYLPGVKVQSSMIRDTRRNPDDPWARYYITALTLGPFDVLASGDNTPRSVCPSAT